MPKVWISTVGQPQAFEVKAGEEADFEPNELHEVTPQWLAFAKDTVTHWRSLQADLDRMQRSRRTT